MPVITGICTKWLKNSQQNFFSPLGLPLPGAGGEEKGKQKLLMPESYNYQQQSQEVKQSQRSKTIRTNVKMVRGSLRLTAPSLVGLQFRLKDSAPECKTAVQLTLASLITPINKSFDYNTQLLGNYRKNVCVC
jgi:hypothetical protein